MNRRVAVLAASLLLLTTACSTESATDTPDAAAGSDDHGAIAGAEEVAEPPLALLSVDDAGEAAMVDLATEATTELGTIAAPTGSATDGRYLFATTDAGVEVVDSGLWTWDHGDHFHYYRAEPTAVGIVPGEGAATVATGPMSTAGSTGIFFAGSGEAVLLDNEALSEGTPTERFRVEFTPHDGIVAPLGDGAVVTVPDASGKVGAVQRVDADGAAVEGSEESCTDPSGTITTAVGLVVGCADGALLWTEESGDPVAERIAYPRGVDAPRATAFHAREGRPTVAALAGPRAFWLLDTRERTWDLVRTDAPLAQVSAADDEDGHVVALDRTGRVRVLLAGSGRELAATRPLVDPASTTSLVVDDDRAYLNDPQEGRVYEIDYADRARIAREIATPTTPTHLAEVGR